MQMAGELEDTICAVATPVGEGGIGIVRISGQDALAVAEKLVRLRSGHLLGSTASHTLHLADFFAPYTETLNACGPSAHSGSRQQAIDEGLVVYMKAPRSFTAEDVVELHCHGSGLVLAHLCEACITAGARLAQPGEFTKRAFLHGRFDLSQAEAVLDTIKAKSEGGLKVAQRHLRGDLGRAVDRMRTQLLTLLAHVEAGIDFVEEDISFVAREELLCAFHKILEDIDQMLSTARSGRLLREGARVVIIGRPNVGKSSLLNSLLREERAIVTNIPGTTRDLIEESVVWDGLLITLIDTAGLRETVDIVEAEGMKRTKSAQGDSDLVLNVFDAKELLGGIDQIESKTLCEGKDFVIINKMDLIDRVESQSVIDSSRRLTPCEVIPISVRTGVGIDQLKSAIRSHLLHGDLEAKEGVTITNVRHRTALQRAGESLRHSTEAVRAGIEPELIAVDLRAAADALGEITGVITSDEVLDQIFAEFCIGK